MYTISTSKIGGDNCECNGYEANQIDVGFTVENRN